MTEIIYYIILLQIFLVIISIFLLKVRTGILILFAVGVSTTYLMAIKFGALSALDLAAIGIPFLLICGLLISGKDIIYEFNKDNLIKYYFGLLIMLLFSGVIFTGLLYSNHTFLNFFGRLGNWAKLLNGFIVLLVVSSLFTDETKINRMLNYMLLSLVIPGSIFIWQIMTGNLVADGRTGYRVATALFYHDSVMAYALVFHFPICLFKYSFARSRKDKLFWGLIIFSFITLIYFTYKRGAWLGLLAQLVTWFFLSQKVKNKLIYGYIFITIAILLPFTQFASTFEERFSDIPTFFNNIPEVFETNQYDFLFTGRWKFFRTNLIYLVEQPITNFIVGNGIGGTHFASKEMGSYGGDHNIYLILLVDFGIVCFLAYLFFLFLIFLKLLRSLSSLIPFVREYSKLLITLLTSYLVMGMITHVLYGNATNWLLWGLLGAFIGLLRNKDYTNQRHYALTDLLP